MYRSEVAAFFEGLPPDHIAASFFSDEEIFTLEWSPYSLDLNPPRLLGVEHLGERGMRKA